MGSYELFVPSKKQSSSKRSETVLYSPSGKLSLRKKVFEQLMNPDYVKFYYDKEERKIAIEPAKSEEPSAIKVAGQNSKSVQIKRFVNHFEIEIPEKTDIPVEQEDNMVVFKVS